MKADLGKTGVKSKNGRRLREMETMCQEVKKNVRCGRHTARDYGEEGD